MIKSVSRVLRFKTKNLFLFSIILFSIIISAFGLKKAEQPFFIEGLAQGTNYHITYYSQEQRVTKSQIDSIITKIDSSMSVYKPYSLISAFNRAFREGKMDEHFKKVMLRAQEISQASSGTFDVTVFPLVEAWGFGPKSQTILPDSAKIKNILKRVGYKHLQIQGDYLIKDIPDLKVDVNGIAQGYTVDVLADFMERYGIKNYLVEVGGELRIQGRKPGNEPFRVGIQAVGVSDFAPVESYVELSSGAITTSGNYRKFHESGGQTTNHLIDPRSGFYVNNGMLSATVYAKDAITADGFDNALMVLGVEDALKLVESEKDMEAFLIYRTPDGAIRDTCSSGFPTIQNKAAFNR